MTKKRLIWVFITIFLFIGCGGGGSVAPTEDISSEPTPTASGQEPIIVAPTLLSDEKQAYLDAINVARATEQDCGTEGLKSPVPALVWNDILYAAAYEHSQDLALNDAEGHYGTFTSSDLSGIEVGHASTPQDRIDYNGYTGYKAIAENVAYGTHVDTALVAIESWLGSDNHCATLMDGNLTEVGMALYTREGSHFTNYWTQDFGAK